MRISICFRGGEREADQVSALILSRFPAAVIRRPKQPSFTDAVKWLWGSVKSPYCLHLEDDWVAEKPITEEAIFKHFEGNVAQVSLLTSEKQWRFQYPFHCKWTRNKIFGVGFGKRLLKNEPVFTTSPSFTTREFANTSALLMRNDLDPEKQMYDGNNVDLRAFNINFRNRLISDESGFLIRDIGRAHRASLGLEKFIENGQSVWKTSL